MTAPQSRALSVEALTRTYPGPRPVKALDGVGFRLDSGAAVALVGPSGCGKSTLLHLVGGMDRADSGTIHLGELAVHALDEDALTLYRRRTAAFIFQFFHLLPSLTVRANAALPLVLDGVPDAAIEERLLPLLERVGLQDRLDHYPRELSGGEMQRVAIARALLARPEVLLADEPTGNLDTATGRRVLDLLHDLHRELGFTLLVATHSAELADGMDRVLALRDGRIVAG